MLEEPGKPLVDEARGILRSLVDSSESLSLELRASASLLLVHHTTSPVMQLELLLAVKQVSVEANWRSPLAMVCIDRAVALAQELGYPRLALELAQLFLTLFKDVDAKCLNTDQCVIIFGAARPHSYQYGSNPPTLGLSVAPSHVLTKYWMESVHLYRNALQLLDSAGSVGPLKYDMSQLHETLPEAADLITRTATHDLSTILPSLLPSSAQSSLKVVYTCRNIDGRFESVQATGTWSDAESSSQLLAIMYLLPEPDRLSWIPKPLALPRMCFPDVIDRKIVFHKSGFHALTSDGSIIDRSLDRMLVAAGTKFVQLSGSMCHSYDVGRVGGNRSDSPCSCF